MAGSDESAHVECLAYITSAATDHSAPAQGATVAGEGRHADQLCDLSTIESAQLGQGPDERAGGPGTHAGDAAQQIITGTPEWAGLMRWVMS